MNEIARPLFDFALHTICFVAHNYVIAKPCFDFALPFYENEKPDWDCVLPRNGFVKAGNL